MRATISNDKTMKYTGLTVSLFTYCFFVSCTFTGPNDKLVYADSLMLHSPDSALCVLQSIGPKEIHAVQDRAYYALLYTQAQYKNFIPLTSDSLIRIAIQYYDSTQNTLLLAKAHYCLGCIRNHANDCPQAIEAFLTSISLAEKTGDDFLISHSYNSIAHIYYRQDFNNKADTIFRLVEKLAIAQKDSALWAESLSQQGKINIERGESFYPKAESQMLMAYGVSHSVRQKRVKAKIASSISTLYSRMGEGEKAVHFAKESIALQGSSVQPRTYLLLGDAYYKLARHDSAYIYLQKSLRTSSSYSTKAGAYMRLADIANEQGKLNEALEMERMYSACLDSLRHKRQDVEVVNTEKKIMKTRLQRQHQTTVNTFTLILLATASISAASILYACHLHKAYKRSGKLLRQQAATPETIPKNNLEKLKVELLDNELYKKIQHILHYYKTFNDYPAMFDELDKQKLVAVIDRHMDDYSSRLKSAYPLLTDKDIAFCCFHLIGLSATDIAVITLRTRNSIYKRTQSILEKKMHLSKDKDLLEVLLNI